MNKEKVIRQAEYILYSYKNNKSELDHFEIDCIYSSNNNPTPEIQKTTVSDPTAKAAIKLMTKNKYYFQTKANKEQAEEYINLFQNRHKRIIEMLYIQHKSVAEITTTLNISNRTFYRQLKQIRDRIYLHIVNKNQYFF